MKTVVRLVDSWVVFFLTVLVFSLYAAAQLWPASYWLDVQSVKAGPAKPFEAVPMDAIRTIHRPFLGQGFVDVRRFGVAGWVHFCHGEGPANGLQYTPDAELPQKLDLEWWSYGECATLPAGRYIVDTTWRINPAILGLPEKSITVRSNIFDVTP